MPRAAIHRDGRQSPKATIALATAAGLSVGNIYAAQPLLDAIGESFGVEAASLGSIVTLTQIGYGAGLILIVPLSDLVDRRRLILLQLALTVAALALVAVAGSLAALWASLFCVGLLAVVVQTIVAFAASLAAPEHRGTAVGAVTSGVVIGILGARVFAGFLNDLASWRMVYLSSAGAMSIIIFYLAQNLPGDMGAKSKRYPAVLKSMIIIFTRDRVTLVRSIYAFAIFASLTAFWSALVLPLRQPPYDLSHGQIGLFGLVGIAGALAARTAGRLADKGFSNQVTGCALLMLAGSWGLIALLPLSLPALSLGIILLDFAIQAVHVTNQAIIVSRHPDAQGQVIAGYMVFYSAGSAVGALGSTLVFSLAGWNGVCLFGGGIGVAALAIWAVTSGPARRRGDVTRSAA